MGVQLVTQCKIAFSKFLSICCIFILIICALNAPHISSSPIDSCSIVNESIIISTAKNNLPCPIISDNVKKLSIGNAQALCKLCTEIETNPETKGNCDFKNVAESICKTTSPESSNHSCEIELNELCTNVKDSILNCQFHFRSIPDETMCMASWNVSEMDTNHTNADGHTCPSTMLLAISQVCQSLAPHSPSGSGSSAVIADKPKAATQSQLPLIKESGKRNHAESDKPSTEVGVKANDAENNEQHNNKLNETLDASDEQKYMEENSTNIRKENSENSIVNTANMLPSSSLPSSISQTDKVENNVNIKFSTQKTNEPTDSQDLHREIYSSESDAKLKTSAMPQNQNPEETNLTEKPEKGSSAINDIVKTVSEAETDQQISGADKRPLNTGDIGSAKDYEYTDPGVPGLDDNDNLGSLDTLDSMSSTNNANARVNSPVIKNPVFLDDFDAESSETGYFGYFVSLVGFIGICFLLFHNKKKLIALLVEGKRPNSGRRRSASGSGTSYRKLENNFD